MNSTDCTAVFFPTSIEARFLKKRLRILAFASSGVARFSMGVLKTKTHAPLLLVETGVGPLAARKAAEYALSHYKISSLWLFGFAGATQKQWVCGHPLIASQVGTSEIKKEEWISTDTLLRQIAQRIFASLGVVVQEGKILTVSRVIETGIEKLEIGSEQSCSALAMEAFPLASLARQAGIPFLEIRWILDPAEYEFPPIASCIDAQGKIMPVPFFFHLIKNPKTLLALPWFLIKIYRARTSMNTFLQNWLEDERLTP